MIYIKGCRIMDPLTGMDMSGDIFIKEGKIERIIPKGESLPASLANLPDNQIKTIHASGMIAAPGLMDPHVHFRDPGFTWKEDIFTGAAAAAAGGFTRVVCMGNTSPAVDCPEVLRQILEKGAETPIHVMQVSTLTKGMSGQELTDMEEMVRAGAAGFSDDGKPVMDEALLLEAMTRAKNLDMPVSLHEEDPLFVEAPGVNHGETAKKLDYPGAWAAAEEVLAARDCMLALHTGARVCIQHVSSAGTVEIIRSARKLGADIHGEATPQHFTLTEHAVLEKGSDAKVNPPLRTEKDRAAIIEGICDGTLDMIATDHAPHSREEKEQGLASAPSGMIGLETALGLGIRSLVETGHISMMRLLYLMSTAPAHFYHVKPASVREGEEADLVLFAPQERWRVDRFKSKSSNSPFIGELLPGRIHWTICRGKVIAGDIF